MEIQALANLVEKENVENLTSLANHIGDYFSVMKPPIALLNVFVGICAVLLAAGSDAPIASILVIAAAGFFSAGGAGAINCYIDRELDKHMTRTHNRPIPGGRISGPHPRSRLGFVFRGHRTSSGVPEPADRFFHRDGNFLVHLRLHALVET